MSLTTEVIVPRLRHWELICLLDGVIEVSVSYDVSRQLCNALFYLFGFSVFDHTNNKSFAVSKAKK